MDASDEIIQSTVKVAQPENVGDVTAAFYRENEIGRRLFVPGLHCCEQREAIERVVEFDRGEAGCVKMKLFALSDALIEIFGPFLVAPAAGADMNEFHLMNQFVPSGVLAHAAIFFAAF